MFTFGKRTSLIQNSVKVNFTEYIKCDDNLCDHTCNKANLVVSEQAGVHEMLVGWKPLLNGNTQHPVGFCDAEADIPHHISSHLSPVVVLTQKTTWVI